MSSRRTTVFDWLREHILPIRLLVKLQNSALYPFLFAVLCIISGVGDRSVYIPMMIAITALSAFAGLFSPDLKVFLAPAFMIFCTIGMDLPEDHYETKWISPTFDRASLPTIIICFGSLALILIYRMISSGIIKDMLSRKSIFLPGILLVDAALILNGIFSETRSIENLYFGLFTVLPLTVFYLLFVNVLSDSEKGISYACRCLVALGWTATVQIAIIAYRMHLNDALILRDSDGSFLRFHRQLLTPAWALPTIVAGIIAIAIPAALYLARRSYFSFFYILSPFVFLAATVFIDTRSAIIVGSITLILGLLLCCSGGRMKHFNRIFTVLIFAVIGYTAHCLLEKYGLSISEAVDKLLPILRLDHEEELSILANGRIIIWKQGIADFKSSPLFGSGFMAGDHAANEIYHKMYHNIIIEFLGSMGVFGIFAFAVHIKHGAEVLLRRFNSEKTLLLLVPISIVGMSMVDNFFFYPNFQFVYATFLACAEISLEKTRAEHLTRLKKPQKDKKPRVVFTYVEAGKGHIVPTRTVCDAFRKKYGDRCEVVESHFFTETGDKDLESSERLFTAAVRGHNHTPIMSLMCRLANIIAGDAFMLYFLFNYTFSGMRSRKPALKHLKELDADIIFTAHWSVAYHANRMKNDRPYTVFFCPDIIPNGAFNVDCNKLLIANDAGFRHAKKIRMFAGGNITRVPFPARPEISELRNADKHLLRRALGLEDIFTVSLSDGGYGIARMEKTVGHLLECADQPMNVIAFCGTNAKLYTKLCALRDKNPNVRLIPLEYTEHITEYLAASDLFVGKGGANSIAEPISLGVPVIITKCITYVERWIKNYYVKSTGGALYIPNAKKAAREICRLAHSPRRLSILRKPLAGIPDSEYDAEKTADVIWEGVELMGFEAK